MLLFMLTAIPRLLVALFVKFNSLILVLLLFY